MRFSDPLHLGALLYGVAAAFWALSTFVSLLLPLGILVFISASVVLLFARRMDADARRFVVGGAVAGLAAHAMLAVMFLIAQPFGFGRDPARAVSFTPPAWATTLSAFYTPLYMILIGTLVVLSFYFLWGRRERVIGIVGVGLVALVLAVGYSPLIAPAALGGIFMFAFAIGFGLIAAASLIPPIRAEERPWSDAETTRSHRPVATAETP